MFHNERGTQILTGRGLCVPLCWHLRGSALPGVCTAGHFLFINCELFFGKQETQRGRVHTEPRRQGPATDKDSEKTATPLARWCVEPGGSGGWWHGAGGGGQRGGSTLLDTEAEIIQRMSSCITGQENLGTPTRAPAHPPCSWCPHHRRGAAPRQSGRGWRGLVCAGAAGGMLRISGSWVEVAGQRGQDRGVGRWRNNPIPPFTWGAHCREQSPGPCGRACPPRPRT